MYLNLLSDFNAVLPEKFQFNDTENNKDIAKMFTHGWLVPFLDIVILTPLLKS